jgi:hypothetical protein
LVLAWARVAAQVRVEAVAGRRAREAVDGRVDAAFGESVA